MFRSIGALALAVLAVAAARAGRAAPADATHAGRDQRDRQRAAARRSGRDEGACACSSPPTRCAGARRAAPNIDIAAQYVAAQFYAAGLQAGGRQGRLSADGAAGHATSRRQGRPRPDPQGAAPLPLVFGEDYVPGADRRQGRRPALDAPVVFVGYGIVAPQYARDDYAGRRRAAARSSPIFGGAPSRFQSEERAHFGSPATKATIAAAHGAIGMILLESRAALGRGGSRRWRSRRAR